MGREGRPSAPELPAARSQQRWQPFWRLRRRALWGEDHATKHLEEAEPVAQQRLSAVEIVALVWGFADLAYAVVEEVLARLRRRARGPNGRARSR